MNVSYSLYHNIGAEHAELFNELFDKYELILPKLNAEFCNVLDRKAAVFNSWVRYCKFHKYLILKSEKTFTHSFPEYLSNYLRGFMSIEVSEWLDEHQDNYDYLFIFIYFVVHDILERLDLFLEEEENFRKIVIHDYFLMTNSSLEESDQLFLLFKECNTKFIANKLTPAVCRSIYFGALQNTKKTISSTLQNK